MRPRYHKWTEKEEKFIIDNYYSSTYKKIAESLGLSWSAIARRIQILVDEGKLINKNNRQKKRKKTIKEVNEYYYDINQKLRKKWNTESSETAFRNGLRWTVEEEEKLIKMIHNGYTYFIIAKNLNRTYNSVFKKVKYLRKEGILI